MIEEGSFIISELNNANPFASPALGQNPTAISPIGPIDDTYVLAAAGIELSRARFWLWCVGMLLVALAWLLILATIYFVAVLGEIDRLASHVATIFIYGVSGILLLRCHGKVGEFLIEPEPRQLEEVFEAEASYWKFLGLVTLASVAIIVAMVAFALLMRR